MFYYTLLGCLKTIIILSLKNLEALHSNIPETNFQPSLTQSVKKQRSSMHNI